MLTDYHMKLNRAGIPVWRPAQPVIGREDEHQTALTQWARMMRTQYPALQLYHHIPNGGLRDKRTAARLIGQGGYIPAYPMYLSLPPGAATMAYTSSSKLAPIVQRQIKTSL